MCSRERASLQRGMNFRLVREYSVILMSVRANAPYQDRLEEEGSILIYEGHDAPRRVGSGDPKLVDQPDRTPRGRPTENGRFWEAAHAFKAGAEAAHLVRVYEKIHQGIWSFNGTFQLLDAWREHDGNRFVFKFKLAAFTENIPTEALKSRGWERRRMIPTHIKVEVWKRDRGKCVICGEKDELHFDHDLPFSLGGSSLTAANVQLMCARHNLSKGSKIL